MSWLATKLTLALAALCCSAIPALVEAQAPVEPLEGLDPVLLVEGKEVQGDPKLSVDRDGFRYSFSSPETRARFEREPERFEIQLHGLCARMGETTLGNPDLFLVHEGRIYLFGSPQCRDLFRAAPQRFLESPPAPPLAETADAASREQGRRLVEAAVVAMGGAEVLDGVERFEVRAREAAGAGEGAAPLASAWTYHFPDHVRLEEQRPFGLLTWVMTPSGAFNQFERITYPLNEVQSAHLKQRLARHVLGLLKARRETGFVSATLSAARVGETAVERVAVTGGGADATLGVDPATGRVLSLTYRDRFDDGAWGEVVEEYSDFRAAGGLTLPFRVLTTWNGQPWPGRTRVVETVAVNRELPAGTFERPSTPGAP